MHDGATALPSDGDLAEAIAAHDPLAEAELYRRFGPRVLFLARRELRDADRAEDARSETFLRVLASLRAGRLREPAALAGFVLQTTRHIILEVQRQLGRAATRSGGDVDEVEVAQAEPVDPETVDAVRRTIEGLSPRDRQFLKMHYYDELPKADIARRLGIEPERVRLVKSRALQRFRAAYLRDGVVP